jgi:hypothetical protein
VEGNPFDDQRAALQLRLLQAQFFMYLAQSICTTLPSLHPHSSTSPFLTWDTLSGEPFKFCITTRILVIIQPLDQRTGRVRASY